MIMSPCRRCQNKNLPKDECLKTCALIRNIQSLEMSLGKSPVYTAVDFCEESRFHIAPPLANAMNVC